MKVALVLPMRRSGKAPTPGWLRGLGGDGAGGCGRTARSLVPLNRPVGEDGPEFRHQVQGQGRHGHPAAAQESDVGVEPALPTGTLDHGTK